MKEFSNMRKNMYKKFHFWYVNKSENKKKKNLVDK